MVQPELTWDMFPPVTEREWALPWHHERFKLRDNPEAFQTGRSGQEGDKSIWREDSQDEGFSGGSTDTEAGNESYQQIGSGASQGAGPGSTSTASRRASEDESDGVNLEGPLARVLAVSTASYSFPLREAVFYSECALGRPHIIRHELLIFI